VPGGRRGVTLAQVLPSSLAQLSRTTWHGVTAVQVSLRRMSTSLLVLRLVYLIYT
jgi:hypothetical protein